MYGTCINASMITLIQVRKQQHNNIIEVSQNLTLQQDGVFIV